MKTKHLLLVLLVLFGSNAYEISANTMNSTLIEESAPIEMTKAEKKAAKAKQKAIAAKRKAAGNFLFDDDASLEKLNPLGRAIYEYDNEEVKRLLDSGVSAAEMQGLLSPLCIAVKINNVEAVKMLLESTTLGNINARYTKKFVSEGTITEKNSIIVDAIEIGNPEVLKLIMDKNPEVDYVYEKILSKSGTTEMVMQSTPLLDVFRKLSDIKANSTKGYNNFKGEEQYTQLLRVVNATDKVNRILVVNSNICLPGNKPKKSPTPNFAYSKSLMMYINDMCQSNPDGNTYFNRLACAFIDKGVDGTYKYPIANEGYLASLKFAGVPATQIKIIKSANLYNRNVDCKFNSAILKHMLEKGWKIDASGDKGAEFFVSLQNLSSIKLLVERGMDINVQNKMKSTILFINMSNPEVFEELLKMGANPNVTGVGGMTMKQMSGGLKPSVKKKIHKLIDEYSSAN